MSGEIKGRKWNFNNQTYIGVLGVELYEETCREGVEAKIEWKDGETFQSILFFNHSNLTTLGTKKLIISSEMDEFALAFEDGTILATSEEMYKKLRLTGC